VLDGAICVGRRSATAVGPAGRRGVNRDQAVILQPGDGGRHVGGLELAGDLLAAQGQGAIGEVRH